MSRHLLVEAGESAGLVDPAAATPGALRHGLRAAAELSDAAVAGEHLGALHGLPLPVERADGWAVAGAGGRGVGDRGRATGASAGEVAGATADAAVGTGDRLDWIRDIRTGADGMAVSAWNTADESVAAGGADGA